MTRDWHSIFAAWSKPPSETEEAKASSAARMIKEAIRKSPALAGKNFEVYATGSYRNNTNTRADSDIDVAIVLTDACWSDLPSDGSLTREMLGLTTATYGLTEFRDEVGRALVAKFGAGGVSAGDKAYNVHETSSRLDADAAVFLAYRRYSGKRSAEGLWLYDSGVETRPRSDANRRIVNWHQQHYDRGLARHEATKRRYKRVVRILKRLRTEMTEQGTPQAKAAAADVPSFLIECLCFNASDSCFYKREDTIYDDVSAVIADLWNACKDSSRANNLLEVSRMKLLFGSGNQWKPEQAQEFLLRAWHHVGFK